MEIKEKKDSNTLIFSVSGRLDATSVGQFEKHIMEFINKGEKKLMFDLSGVEYVSSAGLRGILTTSKALKAQGGELRLIVCAGPVMEVFKITGLSSIFKIFNTLEAALA
ncbi:MAG: STAS domain-containing protein [Nitrospirae bacterium]|nr:STAS domain-containing protein [Nitrospirota bacterium]